jgi:phosphonate transport system substrate-binding protein
MPTRLVLGDIEPDEPLTRAQRFRPLASLLERRLAPYGVSSVSVVIAPNIETMAAMMRRGEVDLLFDSIFPTLMVRSQTAITPVLARQVNKPLYSSLLIARIDGPASLEELRGEILALQDPHSTSGFLLPKILLQRAGIEPEILTDWSSPVSQERCGIWLCGSEENVVELVRTGKVAAGALSDEHYAQLPSSLRHGLRIVASSPQVPRQIVSVRGNLDPSLLQALRRVLLAIDDEERRSLAAEDPEEPWNWQFANLDDAALAMLEEIELSMSVVLSPGDS